MRALRAAALYLVLTVLLTTPLAFRLRTMDAGDSAYFAWVMAWEAHALKTDPARLPHGNMFHPLRYTLGMDEPVFGTTLLVLPLFLVTDDAVLVFNLARLLTFVLSALAAYLLVRSLAAAELPALLAGAAFAFSPIRTDQIAHLSTLGTQWLPLVLLFLFRFFRLGRARDALLAALFFVLEALACGYHGLVGLIVLPMAVLPLLKGRRSRLPMALLAAALAALGLAPLYLLHHAALAPLHYARGVAETEQFSAALESFLATGSWNHIWGEATAPFRTTYSNNLFPGLVLPLSVVAGAIALRREGRRPSREAVALGLMALAAVAVALGPEVRLLGRDLGPGPFALARRLPIFRMIRVPSRAGAFIALALAALAAKAWTRWRGHPVRLLLIGAAALAETVIAPIPMPAWAQVVDSRRPPPPVYAWLAAQPDEPVVAELPIQGVEGIVTRPAFHESIYLVRSTRHWKPLVNGYAGIEPEPYLQLREAVRRFPSDAALDALRRRDVRYVVVHQGGYGPLKWARIERDLPLFSGALREVARFDGDTVYELAR
ncbi:MAG: hypothetical protein DMF81_11815 [Acidobacteria bacterium]|nr:MAG: hypothetical protein DMF81_11815 [Acidobacteriota bacterium]